MTMNDAIYLGTQSCVYVNSMLRMLYVVDGADPHPKMKEDRRPSHVRNQEKKKSKPKKEKCLKTPNPSMYDP